MTAKRTKAPYGSAPKKTCKKCDRKISCTNISKHIKVCKGIKLPKTRSEIRKKSWEKNRTKRVGFQRDQRALREADGAPALPQPKPKGMSGHPLEVLCLHPGLFEHAFAKAEKHELLSKKWFHSLLLFLRPDKSHHLPQEWQNAQNYTAVRESFKLLPQYKEDMEEASTRTVYEERVRIEKYRLYIQTKFKQRFNNWEAKCKEIRDAKISEAKEGLVMFAEYADCVSFDDFKVIY
ncbi:hypothetical protein F441_15186 [Phytophthora nicotianae CJ01A1]|uniref:Uncharacterized protein n=1 Tax=Phytophthora nicotianae CJ01A1 TaxID=1317063 RepID=W2WEV4_PHYNI|nr:hypothetical protein F441_15186 [Phytophthora nicotianae CJ01A1]